MVCHIWHTVFYWNDIDKNSKKCVKNLFAYGLF